MHNWSSPAARSTSASPLVAAIVFAALATLSFVFFREPPILSDQLDYFSAAWALPDVIPTHRHLRIGLIWPVWGLTRVFGYSEFAYYGIPLLTRFLLGFSTWYLGRHMFSPRVGWVAGLLIMMTPGYTRVASQLLPDYFAAGLLALGMALIFRASKVSWAGRNGLLILLASGALVGWAYLAREYVVVLFPSFALAMLLLRIPLRGWAMFCIGALAMYSLELLWGWLNYADPLIRLSASGSPRETSREFATRIPEILMLLPQGFSTYGGWAVSGFVVLGLVAPLVMAWKGNPAWRVLLAWSVVGWIVFTFIALLPVLFFEGKAVYLRLHMFRYWSIIFPPIFIGATAALFALAEYVRKRLGRPLSVAATLLLFAAPLAGTAAGLLQVAGAGSLVRNNGAAYEEFRQFLQSHPSPPEVLWMDQASGVASSNSLPIYLNSPSGRSQAWTGEVRHLNLSRSNWLDEAEVQPGYVALDRTRAEFGFRLGMPRYFLSPEWVWQTVFRSSNGRILVLDTARPAPATSMDMRVPPAALQVLRAGSANGSYASSLTSRNTLVVQLEDGARVVVTDDAATGLRAPARNQNRVPPGSTAMTGRMFVADARMGGRAAARCLFYDEEGQRRAVWADLAGPMEGDPAAGYSYGFSCRIPTEQPAIVSARALVQFSQRANVEILGLEYGFLAHDE